MGQPIVIAFVWKKSLNISPEFQIRAVEISYLQQITSSLGSIILFE